MSFQSTQLLAETSVVFQSNEPDFLAISIALIVFVLLFSIVIYALTAWLLGRVFKKTGLEAWPAWVPIYNTWKLLELGGQPGVWAALMLLPVVNIIAAVFIIIAMYHIGLNFQKPGGFVLLAIFLPLIWLLILAFDSSTWQGLAAAKSSPESTPPPVN